MQDDPRQESQPIAVAVEFTRGDFHFAGTVHIPALPTRPRQLVPLALVLADAVTEKSRRQAEADGRPITCKAGCGACCRNLVHISASEAYHLADVVERLPEPRRTIVRQRFADARNRLQQAGLLEALRHCQVWSGREIHERSRAYLELQIACPFLEDESCSIYADRPTVCREYLVTSPAEHCARADRTPIQPISLPVSFFHGLARFGAPAGTKNLYQWVPLVLALEWVEAHPDLTESRFPELLLNEFIENLGLQAPVDIHGSTRR